MSHSIELDYSKNTFTVEIDGLTLTIEPDGHATNPREDEHTNKLFLWDGGDFKGDENHFPTMQDFDALINAEDLFVKLPVFLNKENHVLSPEADSENDYIHIGYILMSKEKAAQIYLNLNDSTKKIAEARLKDKLIDYNNFINGKIYCFTITNSKGDILDEGNDYYPQGNMKEIIEEMSEFCNEEYSFLFDKLLTAMETTSQSQM